MATIDDHLRTTAEHLIKLLHNKSKPIGPFTQPSTKSELIRLAQILKRDNTAPLKPIPSLPTSEGASIPSEKIQPVEVPDSSTQLDDTADDITVKTSNRSSSSSPPTSEGVPTTIQQNYQLPSRHASLYPPTSTFTKTPSSSLVNHTSTKRSPTQKTPYDIDIIDPKNFSTF